MGAPLARPSPGAGHAVHGIGRAIARSSTARGNRLPAVACLRSEPPRGAAPTPVGTPSCNPWSQANPGAGVMSTRTMSEPSCGCCLNQNTKIAAQAAEFTPAGRSGVAQSSSPRSRNALVSCTRDCTPSFAWWSVWPNTTWVHPAVPWTIGTEWAPLLAFQAFGGRSPTTARPSRLQRRRRPPDQTDQRTGRGDHGQWAPSHAGVTRLHQHWVAIPHVIRWGESDDRLLNIAPLSVAKLFTSGGAVRADHSPE